MFLGFCLFVWKVYVLVFFNFNKLEFELEGGGKEGIY